MKPTQGRSPANETQVNQTCANCGMKQEEWHTPQGYQQDGETFCCKGCASGIGCTC